MDALLISATDELRGTGELDIDRGRTIRDAGSGVVSDARAGRGRGGGRANGFRPFLAADLVRAYYQGRGLDVDDGIGTTRHGAEMAAAASAFYGSFNAKFYNKRARLKTLQVRARPGVDDGRAAP